jgi:hypothetical protein
MKLVAIITSTWKEVLGIDQEVADIISHYSEWLSRQEYLKCINGTINVRFIIGKNCKRVRNRHSLDFTQLFITKLTQSLTKRRTYIVHQ